VKDCHSDREDGHGEVKDWHGDKEDCHCGSEDGHCELKDGDCEVKEWLNLHENGVFWAKCEIFRVSVKYQKILKPNPHEVFHFVGVLFLRRGLLHCVYNDV
jgi:hypothetical protein